MFQSTSALEICTLSWFWRKICWINYQIDWCDDKKFHSLCVSGSYPGRTSGSRIRERTKSHFEYTTAKENKQKIAGMLIPAHFEVRFSMKLLKFHVKIKREFLFFLKKKFFEKKKKFCLHFRSWSCLLWANFFSCLYLARARARARTGPLM